MGMLYPICFIIDTCILLSFCQLIPKCRWVKKIKDVCRMKDYLRIARFDHWIKNVFIIPGVIFAVLLANVPISELSVTKMILGFLATCFIASANYVINEWLDAPFDQFHPVKKFRPVVSGNIKGRFVIFEYIIFIILGLLSSCLINPAFTITEIWLLVMGILYNVKPIRTKDIIYLDVITESVNNMIRLLLGWFIVTDQHLPPSSILIGYWMAGAFLMSTKRFAEYRMINDSQVAGMYRKSFIYYTEKTLLGSSFFYALSATFFIGVFLIKYRIEHLLAMPVVFLLFTYYIMLSYKKDSAVQKPEKIYREKKLLIIVGLLIMAFAALSFIDIPFLHVFISSHLISI